jgi:hypothetical protein
MIRSKQDALAEMTVLQADAHALLALPLLSEADLRQAEAERAKWLLRVKKALHELMGDSAGLVRLNSQPIEPDGPTMTLEDEICQFQQTVLEHATVIGKVSQLLKHLA